ncbi:hypothetical protein J25TS5_15780 [Paenibacillus faecis]|nr:hypothetical protein J25TS5_15780 [Paenibacillus faecis]
MKGMWSIDEITIIYIQRHFMIVYYSYFGFYTNEMDYNSSFSTWHWQVSLYETEVEHYSNCGIDAESE